MQYMTRLLKEEHRRSGLYLESDDHIIKLMRGQKVLAQFSASGATIENIIKAADIYILDAAKKEA